MATGWKKSCFILPERSDFKMIDILSIAVHPYPMCMLTSLSVDEIFLLKYVNWSTNFRGLPLKMEIAVYGLKHLVLSTFTYRPMHIAAYFRLNSKDSACADVFARSACILLIIWQIETVMLWIAFFKYCSNFSFTSGWIQLRSKAQ